MNPDNQSKAMTILLGTFLTLSIISTTANLISRARKKGCGCKDQIEG